MNAILNVGKKTYELPLAKDYVRHWGMVEAVREIIQNALDSESPFEYEFGEDSLTLVSRYSRLTPQSLLLGCTSKAESTDSIGSFGEGYKIALLVLTREGYPVTIRNGDRVWTPAFRMSRKFDAEVLTIDDAPAAGRREGLAFEIGGLSPDDIADIRASCLYMQDNVGAIMQTPQGRILRERPGKLYVGGLFVCDTELAFGYDVKPEFLRLERDRQTVSTFDLQWLAKSMWFETERWDEIAELVSKGIPDLEYAEHGAPEFVKEACYRHFCKQHPGKVMAKDQAELERLVAQGMKVYVSVSPAYTSLVRASSDYCEKVAPRTRTPEQILQEWFDVNRKHMRRPGIVAFKALIDESRTWVGGAK